MEATSRSWKTGDLFTLPAVPDAIHTAEEDTAFYWVTDSPLLEYLGVTILLNRDLAHIPLMQRS